MLEAPLTLDGKFLGGKKMRTRKKELLLGNCTLAGWAERESSLPSSPEGKNEDKEKGTSARKLHISWLG